MHYISLLILHCTAVTPLQTSSVEQVTQYHQSLGWKTCGYHYVIRRDGTVENGRPLNRMGAHCKGHNRHSIGIAYEGGLDENGRHADTRTQEQKLAMRKLLENLKKDYPKAIIVGHNTFSNKDCPCFDAAKEYADLQP